jgi:hypothetical protein
MNRRNKTAWTMSILLLVAGGLFASGCGGRRDASPDADNENDNVPPATVMSGMIARVYRGGVLDTDVRAGEATMVKDESDAQLEKVDASLFVKGERKGAVKSETGTLFLANRESEGIVRGDFALGGGVEYVGTDGSVITTPELRFRGKDEKLVSGGGHFERRIHMKSSDLICTGERFEVSKDLSKFMDYGARWRTGEMETKSDAKKQ